MNIPSRVQTSYYRALPSCLENDARPRSAPLLYRLDYRPSFAVGEGDRRRVPGLLMALETQCWKLADLMDRRPIAWLR